MSMKVFDSFDDYLSQAPPEPRKAIQHLREVIHSIVPEAEEGISYGMAAFRYKG